MREFFVPHLSDARLGSVVAKYKCTVRISRGERVMTYKSQQSNVSFRFQPIKGSPDAILFDYLRSYSQLSLKEAILLPVRAFWLPLAYRVLRRSPQECRRVCEESLTFLTAQVEVVKIQLGHLPIDEEVSSDNKSRF
jgi:hypothetical protein